jgi:hypothetical protein
MSNKSIATLCDDGHRYWQNRSSRRLPRLVTRITVRGLSPMRTQATLLSMMADELQSEAEQIDAAPQSLPIEKPAAMHSRATIFGFISLALRVHATSGCSNSSPMHAWQSCRTTTTPHPCCHAKHHSENRSFDMMKVLVRLEAAIAHEWTSRMRSPNQTASRD